MKNKLSANRRKEIILEYILKKGFSNIEDLMQLVNVSRMTIHRDLDELEKLQIIRKVRNSVSAQPSSLFESDWSYRENINVKEKEAMCQLANSLIDNGISIYLDDSTTIFPLIKYLKKKSLTIITACIPIIDEIISVGTLDLIVLGGNYDKKFRSNYGRICINTIENLHPDLSIMSSVSYMNGSVYQSEIRILDVKRAMLNNAVKKMILIDHTKINNTALYHLANINEFDFVIIDSSTQTKDINEMKSHTKDLYIAT